jgi:YegS/Rv2252/BmrU family lipid kinase
LKERKYEVITQLTGRKFHASDIAKTAMANGADLIVSVGGDGTFSEIVNGMLSCGQKFHDLPEVIMLPIGTGTDLSKTVKFAKDSVGVVDTIENGITRAIDVGKIVFKAGGKTWMRCFVNVFDIGLGGSVVRIANRIPKYLGGFLTFLLSSFVALLTFRQKKMQLWIDREFIGTTMITIVGALNGQFFGGGMHAAPMASIDDGILEFIYVTNTNIFKFLIYVLSKVYEGDHLKYHNVYHYRGTRLRVKCKGICLMDVDGEEERAEEVIVSVKPKAIKLRLPHQ